MTTIKELAEELSVSKVAITKWLEKNIGLENLEKVGNKYVLSPDTADAVKRAYTARRGQKKPEPINTASDTENTLTAEIIALLRAELAEKDKMIDRLQTQVENLTNINADMVKAVHQLNTLSAMQLAEPEKPEEPIEKAENRLDLNEEPKKRSFLDWFKR